MSIGRTCHRKSWSGTQPGRLSSRPARESPRLSRGHTQTASGPGQHGHLHTVAFGGALPATDIGAVMAGPGGRLILNGLYLLADEQHADHHNHDRTMRRTTV